MQLLISTYLASETNKSGAFCNQKPSSPAIDSASTSASSVQHFRHFSTRHLQEVIAEFLSTISCGLNVTTDLGHPKKMESSTSNCPSLGELFYLTKLQTWNVCIENCIPQLPFRGFRSCEVSIIWPDITCKVPLPKNCDAPSKTPASVAAAVVNAADVEVEVHVHASVGLNI